MLDKMPIILWIYALFRKTLAVIWKYLGILYPRSHRRALYWVARNKTILSNSQNGSKASLQDCTLNANSSFITQSICFGKRVCPPFTRIHEAFACQATLYPNITAIEHRGQSLSYRQLDILSDQLSMKIQGNGVTRGSRVCLLVHRSFEMVIGMLAILKAGASYIPLDGGIVTDAALASIADDVQLALLLYSPAFQQRAQRLSVPSMDLQKAINNSRSLSSRVAVKDALPSDEAYIIYTSGTTGRPKGVSVSHGNVTNLLCTSPGNLAIKPGSRVAQILNIAFDMGVWEILGCILNGGTLVMRGSARAEWNLALKSVDVMICTPSILARYRPEDYPNIKTVATAGEACTQQLADEWSLGRQFFNCCGPTEVTIVNTMHRHCIGETVSIGRPTPNNAVYVLDDEYHPVPFGCAGTLWAGGSGVCRGYVNRDQLTKTLFRQDPFWSGSERGVMYNTGDRGIMRPDGDIIHLGRIDNQVKIKGFRVELDGVTAAMAGCAGITSTCALLIEHELWGFYAPAAVKQEAVRDAVGLVLPYYAVPTRYGCLDALPLTSNGKIDKLALREMVLSDRF